jgi:hypothetical protein
MLNINNKGIQEQNRGRAVAVAASLPVSLHCAAAVSAKRDAKPAPIVPV